ncbi:50S ribosomal protein L9 [Arcanobacterium canis]|uniref:Large ribosomal subunit protein bL9 n=1 Tax=Arcanobacterium canis TaxID=999183 RepID=A0ABY8FXY6_9ACTO|nr:50S ribosomal protein L9 [Arcanobacterium canis]WFM83380.1 50S ribosomal protein L9 [Arcanobacterium canis]
MKIILTHGVKGLGDAGDVATVKDGYARNYLIPRGYATAWTKGAQRQIDQITESRRKRATESIEAAREAREAIEGVTFQIVKTAGENGRLFGGVSTADVAQAINAATGKNVDRRSINLSQHIKSVGEYTALVKLGEDIEARANISVVAA